jgi:hypothetical protein
MKMILDSIANRKGSNCRHPFRWEEIFGITITALQYEQTGQTSAIESSEDRKLKRDTKLSFHALGCCANGTQDRAAAPTGSGTMARPPLDFDQRGVVEFETLELGWHSIVPGFADRILYRHNQAEQRL